MKRTLLLTAIVAFAGLNTAQADDFGLWGDLAVQKNITKSFSVLCAIFVIWVIRSLLLSTMRILCAPLIILLI